jgi:hypothetical protein
MGKVDSVLSRAARRAGVEGRTRRACADHPRLEGRPRELHGHTDHVGCERSACDRDARAVSSNSMTSEADKDREGVIQCQMA